MNPHDRQLSSPLAMISSVWHNRHLIWEMSKHEVTGRYKGSIFGISWSFFNPLMMLAVYTFVFSFVFEAKWGIDINENKADFALILFIGLIIHSLFAEVLNNAPKIILNNGNYVKKIVFPLEILTVVNLGAALFHALVSMLIMLITFTILNGIPNWTIIYTPLTLFPLLLMTLGLGWLIASLGVYVRDIGQIIGVLITMLLFLAPVFYPINRLPEEYQKFLYLNPLTSPIEQTRSVIIFGTPPDWLELIIYTCISITICYAGFWWFQKTRKGFADVI